jgi:hypothetical protein
MDFAMHRETGVKRIDFDRLEVYEAGALLLAELAYPEEGEEKRSEVHASLCSHALRVKCAMEPDWALRSQPIKPIYALRRQDENDRSLGTLERRVRDRLVAGRMAIGFLKEPLTGEVPPGIKRVSINELAQLVLDDVGYTEPENVETRIWRPSLPVIHLASALQLMRYLADPVTGPISLEALLLGRELIELLIRTAEYHEALIVQSRHLRVAPERLIRFRLA